MSVPTLLALTVPGINGRVRFRTKAIGDESMAITVDIPGGPVRSGLLCWTGQRWRIDSGEIRVFADTTQAVIRAFAQAVASC